MLKRLFQRRGLWSVRIFRTASIGQFLDLSLDGCELAHTVQQPLLRTSPTFPSTIADPFLFVHGERLYLFYEVQTDFGHGAIHADSMGSDGNWQSHGCVLRESFHLSFPNVFRVGDGIYMLPEAASCGKVVLYRSVRFPTDWIEDSLLAGAPLLDPVLIERDGHYLLLGTSLEYELQLFRGERLEGPFYRIGSITTDRRVSRNAGRILRVEDRMFRVSQDCLDKYGARVSLSELVVTDEGNYEETLVRESLFDRPQGWMDDGYHTFNVASFGGAVYVALDGRRKDLLTNNILLGLQKLAAKLGNERAPTFSIGQSTGDRL